MQFTQNQNKLSKSPLSQSSIQAKLRKFKLANLIFFKIFLRGNSRFPQSRLKIFNQLISFLEMIPYSRPKCSHLYTLSQCKLLENHTLHSGTNLYSPYMAVPPAPPRGGIISPGHIGDHLRYLIKEFFAFVSSPLSESPGTGQQSTGKSDILHEQ